MVVRVFHTCCIYLSYPHKGEKTLYLKSIELSGFKSFADKTILTFEPGITAVVGPNGSGKSNISDAIRWVMGETSAKTLRGGNMQDVIFSGTQKRKPVNIAEVMLTLDNHDRALGLDFGEITVGRRLYRSGESEYYINGAQCRLKDVFELFMDTGVGRDGYSIISQGKVEEIISSKSEDRRTLFEEASGISKYRHRKDEAQRKLGHTQDNLVRLGDIVNELSGQIEPLFNQSEKAKKYLNLREQLKVLEVNIAVESIDKNRKAIDEITKSFTMVTEELERIRESSSELESEIERLNQLALEREGQLAEHRDLSSDTEVEIKGFVGEIEVLRSNIAANISMAERISGDMARASARADELEVVLGELEAQMEQERRKLGDATKQMDALNVQSEQFNAALAADNAAIGALKADMIEKMNDISITRTKIQSLETFKENFIERRGTLERDALEIDTEIAQITAQTARISDGLEVLQTDYQRQSEARADSVQSLGKLKAQMQESTEKLDALSLQYNQKSSRLHMLRDMEKDLEGFHHSVKAVLTASRGGKLSGLNIHGALSELIDVDKAYVTALEIALGGALQNIVVENESDGKATIAYLKQQRLGRVTFLPISAVRGRIVDGLDDIKRQPGYIGVASELIGYASRYDGIVKSLLGRTVLVDNIDNAIAMSRRFGYKFRVVTLEGEVLNAGGSMSGGSVSKTTGLLSRAGDIKLLESETAALTDKIDALKLQMGDYGDTAQLLEEKLGAIDEKLRAAEQDLVRMRADLEHSRIMQDAAAKSKDSIDTELGQISDQIKDTDDQIAAGESKIIATERDIERAKAEIGIREDEFEGLSKQREDIAAKLTEQSVTVNSIQKDIAALEYRIREAKTQLQSANEDIAAKAEEIAELGAQNAQTEQAIGQKEQQICEANAQAADLRAETERLALERTDAQQAAKDLTAQGKESRDRMYVLKEEQSRIDNKRTKAEMELENVTNRLWDDYEITYTSAQEYRKDIGSVAAAGRQTAELKAEIRELGNVNVDAIEEYKSVKERYDFMSTQVTDLTEAKEHLEKLIEEIQEKMEKQFIEQFAIIAEQFSKVFVQLFGGGQAALRLTQPDNVLESGVEIDAQPPGKKLQNLTLLSGGEKAFTAIALLFSILNVRPAPFCVLDEIEAALDEPNVYRFGDYLKDYSKKTQFIMVSHRRGTMEAADLLYGVTMQEQGVSKLLALKIDDVGADM